MGTNSVHTKRSDYFPSYWRSSSFRKQELWFGGALEYGWNLNFNTPGSVLGFGWCSFHFFSTKVNFCHVLNFSWTKLESIAMEELIFVPIDYVKGCTDVMCSITGAPASTRYVKCPDPLSQDDVKASYAYRALRAGAQRTSLYQTTYEWALQLSHP